MAYSTSGDGTISYKGNKIFDPIEDIQGDDRFLERISDRQYQLHEQEHWSHLSNVNHHIYQATVEYFNELGSKYTLLPLTTRLISSPGAVFGSETIDYTEETSPITLEWFDMEKTAFLSESSQVYLELALAQQGVDQVHSIYNSFRKEEADNTHLSEFHHIEYEGQIGQERNEEIVEELLVKILDRLLDEGRSDLKQFLGHDEIVELEELRDDPVRRVTFDEALSLLREDTGDKKYEEFTEAHFSDWEEVRLTELFDGKIVAVQEYPLLEVPFYHAEKDTDGPRVAKNADFIWPGYRETVGTGERVAQLEDVEEKADLFNLPREDYEPYIRARRFDDYERTSGFGVGWERLVQGLLNMPSIISVTHFPRTHTGLKP
ncbi:MULTISPECIES: amino acid--tRNA ligase-related protein [Natrinema]|uniref:Asparaginyl-tRNA ligase n=1 Tax=Natrinema gari JCM 14663 TaxID=1230459 RepID=L9Z0V8_9EURY|nr:MULTISPECIES: amino acid--tRNA ligase-related protein [Natrinema]AFO55911.1 asparagine--tRNA ligase [Natrinema sp. J7-2]ELY79511.1 asparaginyl-tRNA ligase [Natrinema gari JCM 14663]